jgi:hypothetical protein
MSTRLLANPGSRHTITDDLESHFFVLMWTALHWVEHNQSGCPLVDMEFIFDQQRPYACGIIRGGAGKGQMYASRDSGLNRVQFTCKPFNDLFWRLWMLFSRFLGKRQEAAREGEPGEYSSMPEP